MWWARRKSLNPGGSMRRLKLNVNDVEVETFVVAEVQARIGTVVAAQRTGEPTQCGATCDPGADSCVQSCGGGFTCGDTCGEDLTCAGTCWEDTCGLSCDPILSCDGAGCETPECPPRRALES